jgi:hypothetical protein
MLSGSAIFVPGKTKIGSVYTTLEVRHPLQGRIAYAL